MYAVWHGPEGLLKWPIVMHCHILTLAQSLRKAGYKVNDNVVFDSITVVVDEEQKQTIQARAMQKEINYRYGRIQSQLPLMKQHQQKMLLMYVKLLLVL